MFKYVVDKEKGYLLLIANGFWKLEIGENESQGGSSRGFREEVLEKVMEQWRRVSLYMRNANDVSC